MNLTQMTQTTMSRRKVSWQRKLHQSEKHQQQEEVVGRQRCQQPLHLRCPHMRRLGRETLLRGRLCWRPFKPTLPTSKKILELELPRKCLLRSERGWSMIVMTREASGARSRWKDPGSLPDSLRLLRTGARWVQR